MDPHPDPYQNATDPEHWLSEGLHQQKWFWMQKA
jgi:hypothetical protein